MGKADPPTHVSPPPSCPSGQDPRTPLPPALSQTGVKKSWKGKKGPGGSHPRVAVTFAGLISQDWKPSPRLPPSPSSPLALARAPGAVGPLRWLPATVPNNVSASPHTSPVCRYPSAVSRPLLGVPAPWGRRHLFVPHLCSTQHRGGLPAPTGVTWGTALAQSQSNPKMRPRRLKQEGAFSAERRLSCPASVWSLYTIAWIFFHPKGSRGLTLGIGVHPKSWLTAPYRKETAS